MLSHVGRVALSMRLRASRIWLSVGEPAAEVARNLGMSGATFYRRARALGLLPELGSL
ncbi:hypothetical protein RCH16_002464 [Cryobacterium sp. MP_M5]|nr:hypothetical protein [Cryobacterium sp. MP_M3]MEC5177446.1 hypothetical protein [Cryobacterium sp. MP_M5]